MDYYRNNEVFKFLLLFTNGRQEFDPQVKLPDFSEFSSFDLEINF